MTDNGNILSLPDKKELEAEAAEWLVRLDDEESGEELLVAFAAWRNQSDHHREAFEKTAAYWGEFDRLEALNDYAASVALSDTAQRAKMGGGIARRISITAMAASIALIIGVGIFWRLAGNTDYSSVVYQTAIGEQETINLADGSVIELNTNSLVEIDYAPSLRKIRLVQGEAYFDVAPDPERPFSVFAGKGVVTAIGTAFTVRMNNEKFNVVVAKGRVSVGPTLAQIGPTKKSSPQQAVTLTEIKAGQDATFDGAVSSVGELDAETLTRKLSWRNGVLSFAGEPLSAVLADISRYTDMEIELAEEDLRDLPVDGYFKVDDAGVMIEAIETMANLEATSLGGNRIRLSKAMKAEKGAQ